MYGVCHMLLIDHNLANVTHKIFCNEIIAENEYICVYIYIYIKLV